MPNETERALCYTINSSYVITARNTRGSMKFIDEYIEGGGEGRGSGEGRAEIEILSDN